MRRFIASTIVAAALLTGAAATSPAAASRRPAVPCQEDQACWNCHTMGNRICGPILIPPAVWVRDEAGTVTYSEMMAETMPGPFVGWGG